MNRFTDNTIFLQFQEIFGGLNMIKTLSLSLYMYHQELYVNGARIIQADIEADNGIIHVIDTFLAQPLEPGNGVALQSSALGYIYATAEEHPDDEELGTK